MKKKFIMPLIALCFVLPVFVVAQPLFNSASACVGAKRLDGQSLIRPIDDTSALVYYYDNTLCRGKNVRSQGLPLDSNLVGFLGVFSSSDTANPVAPCIVNN